jgi:hypothetical protein
MTHMKNKLLPAVHSAVGHLALAIALGAVAFAQTTALTINNSTGKINVPPGLTPYFDILNVAGAPIPLAATPQQYGAIADGTSHPVSEWVTSGRYANLAAVQADFPHVTSLNDEIDWAAAQQALRLHKSLYFPADVNGYVFNKELVTNDDSQMITGGAPRGPYGLFHGAYIQAGSGVDGIRCQNAKAAVSNLTIHGQKVAIHKAWNVGGSAVIDTQTNHNLPIAPEYANGWTITSNTAAGPTIVTTQAPHYLRHGDIIKVTGNTAIPSGFYFAIVTDNAGAITATPSTTSRWLRLVKVTDHSELSAASDGGAASLVKAYQVGLGPELYNGIYPLTNSNPKLYGLYVVLPISSTRLELYDESCTRITMINPSDDDKGQLYTTRHLLGFTDGSDCDYNAGSPDPGKLFSATNIYATAGYSGIYGGTSDGGGKIDHCQAYDVGVCFWADGNLDSMTMEACWGTGNFYAGYMCSRNGGMTIIGGAGADLLRPVFCRGYGNRVALLGVYFEGHQTSDTLPDGTASVYVEGGGNNAVSINGFTVQNQGEAPHALFHFAYGLMDIRNASAFSPMICWAQGGKVYADVQSNIDVNYFGSSALTFDAVRYKAGDYQMMSSADAFHPTQLISGFVQNGTSTLLTIEDSGIFAIGNTVHIRDSVNNDGFNLSVTDVPDATHIVVGHASGVTAGGSGIVEKESFSSSDLEGARFSNVGLKAVVVPWPGGTVPKGSYQVLNFNGKPAWTRVGFDNLEVTRGGTGQTSYATGDLIYASATNTLAKLAAGANGKVLTLSGGVPAWQDATGSITTYVAIQNGALNITSGTTLANVTDLTFSAIPVGKYKIVIDGAVGFSPGGAGYKWDLKGGTAVFTNTGGDYRRAISWNRSGVIYNVSASGDDGGSDGKIYDGETWGSAAPSLPGAGRSAFRYEGVINVTTAGSIIFRHANADGSGDTGQLLGDTNITLIKQ